VMHLTSAPDIVFPHTAKNGRRDRPCHATMLNVET
jgi:hypothetical protein